MDKLHTVEVVLVTTEKDGKTEQRIVFGNKRTKTIYESIPVENFGKNPQGCVEALFRLIREYSDKGFDIEMDIIHYHLH